MSFFLTCDRVFYLGIMVIDTLREGKFGNELMQQITEALAIVLAI